MWNMKYDPLSQIFLKKRNNKALVGIIKHLSNHIAKLKLIITINNNTYKDKKENSIYYIIL